MAVTLTLDDGYLHPRAQKYFRESGILSLEVRNAYYGAQVGGTSHIRYGGSPMPEADKKERKAQRLSRRGFLVNRITDTLGRENEGLISLVDSLIGWTVRFKNG
jgi:hypothetical protein